MRPTCLLRRASGLLFALVLTAGGLRPSAKAAEVYHWDFTQSTTDLVSGVTAVLGNPAGLGPGGYTFTDLGEGITVSQTGPTQVTDTYTIFMVFSLTDNDAGYQRLIDFKNKANDEGMYVYNDYFYFYSDGPEIERTDFLPGQRIVMALRRDGATKVVSCVVNGRPLWSFVDLGDESSEGVGIFSTANNLMRFFEDDSNPSSEHPAGTVSKIRIYDHVLVSEFTLNPRANQLTKALKKAKKAKDKRKVKKIKKQLAAVKAQKAALLNP
jgi:hypothetical protein